jgi:drug/metabolite transporter (DMT)-like permease
MFGVGLMFPLVDGLAKQLSGTHSPLYVSWLRYAAACAFVLPLAAFRHGWAIFPTQQIGAHVLRTVFLVGAMTCYFVALSRIPMATAISAFFIGPIIAMVLAVMLLGERLTARKVASLVLGVAGALIIVRPGSDLQFDPWLLMALASGCLFAFYMIATRQTSRQSDPVQILAFQTMLGVALLTPQAVWTWSTPAASELWMLAALGVFSVIGHIMAITAFRYADASTLAPLVYLELIGSVLIGYFAFGEVPSAHVWIGAAAIILAGINLLRSERLQPADA